jgi:hypothetical protein
MNPAIPWSIAGGLFLAAVVGLAISAPERQNPAFSFIPGNRPVMEDQVQQKLVNDGWTNVRVAVKGRYFVATASKGDSTETYYVDALTGRLRGEDDDDDDWVD